MPVYDIVNIFLWAVGLILFVVLAAAILSKGIAKKIGQLLGAKDRQETIQYIGFGIAGVLALYGIYLCFANLYLGVAVVAVLAIYGMVEFNKRSEARAKNNKVIEKGPAQKRFDTAVEHLKSEQPKTRIAAFHEFYDLARDNEDLRESTFDVLCTYLRHASTTEHTEKLKEFKVMYVKHLEEIPVLLDILFKHNDRKELIFADLNADLQEIDLQSKDLEEANLQEANLLVANLYGALLQKANLREAELQWANLQMADLQEANLQGAYLQRAYLQWANLLEANLQGANLQKANLQGAYLYRANLQKANLLEADLHEANLQETDLQRANLQMVNLQRVKLQKAKLQEAKLKKADLYRANLQQAWLQNADLRKVKNLDTANLSKTKIKGTKFPEGYQPPEDADSTSDD